MAQTGQDLRRAGRSRSRRRKELLATIKPSMRRYLRDDTGDMPEDMGPPVNDPRVISLAVS